MSDRRPPALRSPLVTFVTLIVTCAALAGCDSALDGGPDGSSPPDGAAMDGGGMDAASRGDGSSGGACDVDSDCDDGRFCNGLERCAPADPAADGRGCVAAAQERCLPEERCDEDADACLSGCDAEADADGDGHLSVECGGDDCDDEDANRFVGNAEVCDAEDHDEDCDPTTFGRRDIDGDGAYDAACCNVDADGASTCGADCDDGNPQAAPGASEVCDRLDNDCDGSVDEGVQSTYWPDSDGDGYGDGEAEPMMACSPPPAHVANDTDCDDSERLVNPATSELCDGLDNNCDGRTDEAGVRTFYRDGDGDGYGNPGEVSMVSSCEPPDGYVASANDCDDHNSEVHPGATERCNGLDDDCGLGIAGGGRDTSEDRDGDLHSPLDAACEGGPFPKDDCADSLADVYTGAPERCDGRDNDCSSGGGTDPTEDMDADMHAPAGAACSGGYLRDDCDDSSAAIHPGATELCDRVDSDCSSGGGLELNEDADDDGHAPPGASCSGGFAKDDCDDANGAVYPGAVELCDRLDNDCSSGGGADTSEDFDGDGHAPAGASCTGGFAADDCDDADAATYTGATELCDRLDNDCSSGGGAEASEDFDDDGFAPIGAACSGGALARTDCDDGDAASYPGAVESCDRVDNNCSTGGGADPTEDFDDDGHAPEGATCTGGFPRDDCDDSEASVYAGAPELCDRLDNDCSSGGGADTSEDDDGDGHAPTDATCSGGYPADDCDDEEATIYEGAAELCDRLDNDCSSGGGVDTSEDADGDGHAPGDAACSGGYPTDDCNDEEASVHPDQAEVCDGVDNDCSSGGGADASEDDDGDQHAPTDAACSGGYPRDDCNDGDAMVYNLAPERCDRVDNNCSSGGGADTSEDADADGHAPIGASCSGGYPTDDCNDADATIYEGATERCDRLDNDCSSGGGADTSEDADGDGHAPIGASCSGGFPIDDCNDARVTIYGGAPELCDRLDNDCSSGGGGDSSEDADGDGHAPVDASCSGGYPTDDCEDGDSSVHPGADEPCDRVDSDCSHGGGTDAYEDFDGDGHAPSGTSRCEPGLPGSFPADDCLDTNDTVYTGATEAPGDASDLDENCNGEITCYVDADRDGARTDGVTTSADRDCADAGEAYASAAADCCDADDLGGPYSRPGAGGWHTEQNNCGSWDWNCNDSTNYRWSDTTTGCSAYPECAVNRGWTDGSRPGCGDAESYQTNCTVSCPSTICFCSPVGESRTQQCR